MLAFVLIKAQPSQEHRVYTKLLEIPEVSELNPLFGEYDLIAKIELEDDVHELSEIIEKIRSLEGIIKTVTLTGAKF